MKNNEYKKWYLVLGVFAIICMFFGGSLAYWQWTTNTSERTSVALTVTEEFRCDADGGGNISSEEKSLVPTDCMNSEYAIQRTIKVNPTLFSNNTNVSMDLWLNVNNIGTGLKNSENLMYSLTTDATSCTNNLVTYGSFNGKVNGSKIELLNDKLYSSTFSDTYYLYIWLDKKETSQSTMNQSFNFSLGGECTGTSKGEPFYAVYSADDTSLRFYKEDEGVIVEGEQYEGRTATNVYKGYEGDTYYDMASVPWYGVRLNTTNIIIEDEISPINTTNYFALFTKTSSIDVTNLDMSNVVDTKRMFGRTGYDNSVTNFSIIGLNNWDVSNVIDMNKIFYQTGYYASLFDIGDLSRWDVSKVINMVFLFEKAGYNVTTWDIGDLSEWDVSNVVDMRFMFNQAGYNATTWNIGNLSNWDVSNVVNMRSMFQAAGYNATSWNIGDLSRWDVSNVTDMSHMFHCAGFSADVFDIGNLTNWDVLNVMDMKYMFNRYDEDNDEYSLNTTFNIGDISRWDTSKVTNMKKMFAGVGYNDSDYSLDLSSWSIPLVTTYTDFNKGVESKITAPVWVNENVDTE